MKIVSFACIFVNVCNVFQERATVMSLCAENIFLFHRGTKKGTVAQIWMVENPNDSTREKYGKTKSGCFRILLKLFQDFVLLFFFFIHFAMFLVQF